MCFKDINSLITINFNCLTRDVLFNILGKACAQSFQKKLGKHFFPETKSFITNLKEGDNVINKSQAQIEIYTNDDIIRPFQNIQIRKNFAV